VFIDSTVTTPPYWDLRTESERSEVIIESSPNDILWYQICDALSCDLCVTLPILPSAARVVFLLLTQGKRVIWDHLNNKRKKSLLKM